MSSQNVPKLMKKVSQISQLRNDFLFNITKLYLYSDLACVSWLQFIICFFLLDMKEEISCKMVDPFLDLTKISDSSLHEV